MHLSSAWRFGFLAKKFLTFWNFLRKCWQLFVARFARFCKFFQDRGKKSKKTFGLLAKKTKNIQDLGKKFNIIQDYLRSWQKNSDASDTKRWIAHYLHLIAIGRGAVMPILIIFKWFLQFWRKQQAIRDSF